MSADPQSYEPHPDPQELAPARPGSTSDLDYEPHPSESISISPDQKKIVTAICNLYSGSASESDMSVYAGNAIYDDPWSYCDTRYKIAGQWYGMSSASPSLSPIQLI